MSVDPEVITILKRAGLNKDALWLHKQSGKHIIYHWACEKAAAAMGVRWEDPQIICADAANKLAVILVTGTIGDGKIREWALGEAAPYNTTQTYPFAMAEKRGKDRVILKLLGLHGQVYSEEEADEFKAAPSPRQMPEEPRVNGGGGDVPAAAAAPAGEAPRPNGGMTAKRAKEIMAALRDAPNLDALDDLWARKSDEIMTASPEGQKAMMKVYHAHREHLATLELHKP